MKTLLLALAICLMPYNLLAWEAGEPFDVSELVEMDAWRDEQDQFVGGLHFYGVLTEEEMEDITELTKLELGHFLGSKIAAAEYDEDRYLYHMGRREDIYSEMDGLIAQIQERLDSMPPPAPIEPPVSQQGL